MTAEADLYTALTGYAGLTALVSTRIHPQVMPQDETLPAVVYQRIVGTRVETMDQSGSGVYRVVFQITAWSTTSVETWSVADQIEAAIDAASFNSIQLSTRADYDADTKLFGVSSDYSMWYR